jgi:hypothetical protein
MQVVAPLACALFAIVLAAILGAGVLAVGAAFALYLLAFVLMERRGAPALFTLAPVVLFTGASLGSVYNLSGALWLLVAALAVVPLFLRLGGLVPHRRLVVFLPVALALPLLLLWHPAAATLLASDLSPRLQVLVIGMGTLLALVVVDLLPRRPPTARAQQVPPEKLFSGSDDPDAPR